MNRKDLQNITEVWDSVTICEEICEEWLQERIEERFDFSQYTIEELAEAIQGGLMDRAKQDGAARRAAQGQAFQSFADRGGILGFLQRRLQSARQAVMQRGGPRGQGNRPVPGKSPLAADVAASRRQAASLGDAPARETGVPRGQMPPGATLTAKPTPKPAAAAPTKPATPPASAAPAAPAKLTKIQQDLADLRAMRSRSQDRIIAQGGKPATGRVPGADKNLKDANRAARQYMKQDADLFDIVKGYLLDEGATEEEALKRMATMTEEERNEIIESSCGSGHSKKKKKKSGY